MKIYILTTTHHMGMDGDYTSLLGAYKDYEDAEKELNNLEANERDNQSTYDWDSYDIEELELQ